MQNLPNSIRCKWSNKIFQIKSISGPKDHLNSEGHKKEFNKRHGDKENKTNLKY